MSHKIALIQLAPIPMDPESNFSRAETHIRHAASSGASLAVLPEYALTSWAPRHPSWGSVAEDRKWLQKFQDLAKECKICIVPGTFVEKIVEHSKNGESRTMVHNVAYFIDNKGEILGRYVKKNLWHPERKHLDAGRGVEEDPHMVIDTPVGRVGMLICWDLGFNEAFRALLRQNVQLIIIPTFWTLLDATPQVLKLNPKSESLFLDSILTARAFENTCAVVFCNAGGKEDDGFAGMSQITMPVLGKVCEADGAREQVVMGLVETEVLEEAEKCYRIRRDLERVDEVYGAIGKSKI